MSGWGLAISLLLHLTFVGYLVVRPEPVVEPKTPSGTLIFVEVEPPAPPPPPPVAAKQPPRPPRAQPPPEVAPPPPPEAITPGPSDRPVADAPTAVAPPTVAARPSLVPSGSFFLALDAGAPVAEAEGVIAPQPQSADEMVRQMAHETIGRGRVDRGLVNSYFGQLGKALVKNWDADRVAKAGLKGFFDQMQQNSKLYNEIWADRAAAYGRSGSPLEGDNLAPTRRAQPNERIQGLVGVDLDARKELSREMAKAFKATRRATIRVVQDRTGRLVKVELVEPSNDSNVDREAMKDVRAAAERLPAPPDDALEGRDQLSSLWSFELIVSISPPVPTFTFEFDEVLGFVDARMPLDRRIYKKVRLVAVE